MGGLVGRVHVVVVGDGPIAIQNTDGWTNRNRGWGERTNRNRGWAGGPIGTEDGAGGRTGFQGSAPTVVRRRRSPVPTACRSVDTLEYVVDCIKVSVYVYEYV